MRVVRKIRSFYSAIDLATWRDTVSCHVDIISLLCRHGEICYLAKSTYKKLYVNMAPFHPILLIHCFLLNTLLTYTVNRALIYTSNSRLKWNHNKFSRYYFDSSKNISIYYIHSIHLFYSYKWCLYFVRTNRISAVRNTLWICSILEFFKILFNKI